MAKILKDPAAIERVPGRDLRATPAVSGPTAQPGLGTKRRVILIEFNELCPPLLDRWMAEGKLPNFKKFHDAAQVFVSEADVKSGPHLEPWVQWYSMHTGLSHEQHGVSHLTDGPEAGHRDIWQMLIEGGKHVGDCGSMNAKGFAAPGSFYLPDPWCTVENTSPEELRIFYRFVSRYVQEYTNPTFTLSRADYLRFVSFMATHGLRPSTVWSIVKQLATEKIFDGKRSWQRAPLLDRMQIDVFRHYQRTLRPDFATYFANSTAHYQHSYWRHMDPGAFKVQPSAADLDAYGDAVLFGYRQMDRLLEDFFAIEDDNVMLVLATALSQQPFLRGEDEGGHTYYRVRDIDKLLDRLGAGAAQVNPVMTHQYLAHFADQAQADRAKDLLSSVRYDGRPVFDFAPSNPATLYFGNGVHRVVPESAEVMLGGVSNQPQPYYEVFYHIDEMKSGMHHPDGVLWFKTGNHARHVDKVSILDVLPTLLDFFGVAPSSADARAFRGESLMARLRPGAH